MKTKQLGTADFILIGVFFEAISLDSLSQIFVHLIINIIDMNYVKQAKSLILTFNNNNLDSTMLTGGQ